jgi:hypothetical protein
MMLPRTHEAVSIVENKSAPLSGAAGIESALGFAQRGKTETAERKVALCRRGDIPVVSFAPRGLNSQPISITRRK